MNEINKTIKTARKAHIKFNKSESEDKYDGINIDSQNPIYQAVKLTPISELDYII